MEDNLLEQHLKLVIEANKTTNITRISSWEEGMLLHVKDSLLGLPELNNAPEGLYADIGSGAGYPGIPLAIKSKRETVLVDSVGKKTAILDTIIKNLGLTSVSTYTGRIEDLAREKPESFSVITARALSQLSILMEFASPLLQMGGILICFKAQISSEELKHAEALQEKLGMKIQSDRTCVLEDYSRRIITFQKIATPQLSLPRKTGFAQKKPL